jgi:hypothetical protein
MSRLCALSPAAVFSRIFGFLAAFFRSRAALQIEILALHHQLSVLDRSVKRPRKRFRPLALGLVISSLVPLAGANFGLSNQRPSLLGNTQELSSVLDLEVSSWTSRKTGIGARGSSAHSAHQSRESTLGCAQDPRRVTQAGHRDQRIDGK